MHTLKGFLRSNRKYSGGFIRMSGLKPNKKSRFFQEVVINKIGEPEIIGKKKKAG